MLAGDQAGQDGRSPVAVVICTRDRPELLRGALEALVRHRRPQDDVVIVDSASTDPAVGEIVRGHGVRLLRLEEPGAARARNAGLSATSAPVVAFTDDDCLISEGWTARIERVFAADPAVGFVTGRVVADRETRLPLSTIDGERGVRFDRLEDPVVYGGGANMAFRRAAFEQVGGFDELLGPGAPLGVGEDPDLFWRVIRAGWAGIYDPSITVVHRQWRSEGAAIRRHFAYGAGAGALAVKAIRLGEAQGWQLLGRRVLSNGLGEAWRNARGGYESGAAAALAKAAGAVAGALNSLRYPLVDGRYAARRRPLS